MKTLLAATALAVLAACGGPEATSTSDAPTVEGVSTPTPTPAAGVDPFGPPLTTCEPSPVPTAPTAPTVGLQWSASPDLGYWKDAANVVHIRGFATYLGQTGGLTIFTLPPGFVPATVQSVVVPVGHEHVTVTVDTAGNVTSLNNWTGDYHLDCVAFPAAA